MSERTHRNLTRYRAGLKEVQILHKLKQADPEDKKHIIRLDRTFEHRGHLCLVFESMRCVIFYCKPCIIVHPRN